MLGDLSAIVVFLATLTIGFVVYNRSKLFCELLMTRFFHADELIPNACKEFSKKIPDKITRDNLQPIKIGDETNAEDIEKFRIECEKADKKVAKFKTDSQEDLDKKCNTRSMTSVCLFVFLVCFILLFSPLAKTLFEYETECFLLSFCALSILYVVLGWIFGENMEKAELEAEGEETEQRKRDRRSIARFDTLKHPLYCMLVVIALSVAFALVFSFHPVDFDGVWKYLYFSVIVIGWLNFVAYAIIIKIAINRFKKAFIKKKNELLAEFENIEKTYKEMCVLQKVAERHTNTPQSRISLKETQPAPDSK